MHWFFYLVVLSSLTLTLCEGSRGFTIHKRQDPTKKIIYLATHATTSGNSRGIYQGHNNDENAQLIAQGYEEAVQMGVKLRGLEIQKIFASDLVQVEQTLNTVKQFANLDHVPVVKTSGVAHPSFVGNSYHRDFQSDPSQGDEIEQQRAERILETITTGLKEKDLDTILIVTHYSSQRKLFHLLNEKGLVRPTVHPRDGMGRDAIIQAFYDGDKLEFYNWNFKGVRP